MLCARIQSMRDNLSNGNECEPDSHLCYTVCMFSVEPVIIIEQEVHMATRVHCCDDESTVICFVPGPTQVPALVVGYR